MTKILSDEPPTIPENGSNSLSLSAEFRDFVSKCLAKDYRKRPKYKTLLEHPFIKISEKRPVDLTVWYDIVCGSPRTRQPYTSSSSCGR